jgi:hypothetical protein
MLLDTIASHLGLPRLPLNELSWLINTHQTKTNYVCDKRAFIIKDTIPHQVNSL